MHAKKCEYFTLKGTEKFLERAGDLTFLKTSTQLQIWFDDVLEVTWVFEDSDDTIPCAMRTSLTGISFRTPYGRLDSVSTHYRYQTGIIV